MKRPSEARSAVAAMLPAAVAAGALIAQLVAGKATRDALFLTHFGLALLPAAMIGAALVSSLAMLAFARALTRYSPARVVPAAFALSVSALGAAAWLASDFEPLVTILLYAHSAVFGGAALSAFWSLVNERFDPHAAKRVVGRIGAGGTVGGVVGGLVVWRASAQLSVPLMLVFLAVINFVGFLAASRLAAGLSRVRPREREKAATEGGLAVLRKTPYLRDLALLVLAGALIQALLDWLLSARATDLYGKGQALFAFFALFNMSVGVASFLAQTGLSRVLLERLGLGGTARLQPLVVVTLGALALLAPGIASTVALRGAEAVSRNSFFRSAYELFYTPLPAAEKRPTKTLIDVGFDRIGTTLGGAALLVVAPLSPDAATRAVVVGTIGAAVIAALIATRLQAGYVAALASSLKSGVVALGDDDLMDLTTRKTLAETTALLDREKLLTKIEEYQRDRDERRAASAEGSEVSSATAAPPADGGAEARESAAPRPRREPVTAHLEEGVLAADPLLLRIANLRSGDPLRAREELVGTLPTELAPFVVPLLASDAAVRDAVRALRRIGPPITGLLLDTLLDPRADVRVRRRLPRVLKTFRTPRAASGLVMALRAPELDVRAQVGLALAQLAEDAPLPIDREEIFDIVVHELTEGRRSWGGETTRGVSHVFLVLGLVLEREPLAIALRALRGEDAALRGTAHEYLDVVLPPRVLRALSPLLGAVERTARRRPPRELADELLRSHAARSRPTR